MKKIVFGSIHPNAGKTSTIVGVINALDKKVSYMKPFGDRLIYRRKRLWDYDAALIANMLKLEEVHDDITIGFDHSKMKYTYNEETLKKKLEEVAENLGGGSEVLLIEAGKDVVYGGSVNLDTFSMARQLDAELVFIVAGDDDTIHDEVDFINEYVAKENVKFKGIIINKVHDLDDFKSTYLPDIEAKGIKVLGVVPFKPELTYFTVDYLAEWLLAKVLAGESGMNNEIMNIFVGSILTDEAFRHPIMSAEKKLVIVSGDRTDLIMASLDGDTAAVILTNNFVPHSNIIAAATEKNIPLLLVTTDTYQTAKKVESLEPLVSLRSTAKFDVLKNLIKDNVKMEDIIS
ncbi:MAG TPA: AAA family ATPase [Spirochaetota bacterium]|nr:AAA family ATPase [Spirochaetota bacterium]